MNRQRATMLIAKAWATRILIVLGLIGPTLPGAASAAPLFPAMPAAGGQCRAAIAQAERAVGIPAQLLAAIGRVESGRRDPTSGVFAPWPWTVNAEGQGFFFDSKTEAVAAVRKMRADGIRSIDVGCMQVNLIHHPNAFASLEAAFDPVQNAAYAGKFLSDLHTQTRDWPKAAALYHSANPERGEPYQRKVLAAWPDEKNVAGQSPTASFAWGSTFASADAARPAFGTNAFRSGGMGATPVRRNDPALSNPLNPNGSENAGSIAGRGLDAYRAAPIAMISRIRRIGS